MTVQRIQGMDEGAAGNGDSGGTHAVVIGASMAGLMAAAMLREHFDRVTVIERDRFPDEPLPRKGVPQSRHVHALMLRGRRILESLFPGLTREMIAQDAPMLDVGADMAWLTPAGWGIRFPSKLQMLTFTRDFLDFNVRRRLRALDRIAILEHCTVTRLLATDDARRATGVELTETGAQGLRTTRMLGADLVVDASGRGSRAPKWLGAIGYEPPRETVIEAFIGYASRMYRRPAGFDADWQGIFVQAAPPARRRAGLIMPVEGDRWVVTLAGGGRDYPPDDANGFLEFARSLPTPEIYEALKQATALGPVHCYRATANRWRHFESMPRQPDNFVVLGDAACAFNPVYGQGMTVAAIGVEALAQLLRGYRGWHAATELCGLARRFQLRLAKLTAAPWMLATGEDLRYREAEGAVAGASTRFMHWYMDRVFELCTNDAGVRRTWLEAFQMIAPPTVLFRFGIAGRVLSLGLRRLWRRVTFRRQAHAGQVAA